MSFAESIYEKRSQFMIIYILLNSNSSHESGTNKNQFGMMKLGQLMLE